MKCLCGSGTDSKVSLTVSSCSNKHHRYITETFCKCTINMGNYSSKQSKWCKFMPKMHQNTFGGRVPPGSAKCSSRSPSHNSGLLLRRGSKRGIENRRGLLLRGRDGGKTMEGKEGERDGGNSSWPAHALFRSFRRL